MEDIKPYLRTFNKKLHKLLTLTFSIKIDNINLIYTRDGKSLHIIKNGQFQNIFELSNMETTNLPNGLINNGPTGEEFDSYILNLRFFIQNNDSLSIKKWNDKINMVNSPTDLLKKANELRLELNKVLDSPRLNVKLEFGRNVLTTRDIIETYVYGEYAHSNSDKNRLFHEIGFANGDHLSFILGAKEISDIFKRIYRLNEEILNA